MSKQKTVSLKQEIDTVNDYLAIEKIRFDERLRVEISIPEAALQVQLPPMMLQTLVENAVKHGISKSMKGGEIKISAILTKFHLHIEIVNSGRFEPKETEIGLGLENTRERLAILYEDKAAFSVENFNDTEVITKLDIPL
jgi:LytS/YehU family sensor histidine kinase